MNQAQLKKIEQEVRDILQPKYKDIQVHADPIGETDQICISLFWDRLSVERWNNAESFRCKIGEYQKTIDNEIKPLANK